MSKVYVGSATDIEVEFRNREGALVDPEGVEVVVQSPNGSQTTYTYDENIVKSATGRYVLQDLDLDEAGTWIVRATSESGPQTATEQRIEVERSLVG